MPEVWVTMLSCSECVRYHDEEREADSYFGECDCWCHDGDTDLDDNAEPAGLDDREW
jgi:hypothetical protein